MAYNVGDLKINIGLGGISMQELENMLSKYSGKSGRKSGSNLSNKNISNFNFAYALNKIKSMTVGVKRLANYTSQIIQYGTDYTETLNLWQVAMKGNIGLASEFVDKMNKAYGISEQTLMNAQAIFKNMIGSLGQISDTVAYSISESITQMAIDYSSLYNVSIQSAITKFQSALAGQVRPIRSVSGYDITENTLYQLYQSIGGTKTVRQLSRTEKQLLSILAIFRQMGASGALGDMSKTLDQFANQSRMLSENWKQFATWSGITLQYLFQQTGVLRFLNTLLITASEMAKSFAYYLGYTDPDFGLSWADNIEETNKEIDKLQGKLLDFDKFRAMNGTEDNILGIDTNLLDALKGYDSILDSVNNKARNLADKWLKVLGFVDENDDGIYEMSQNAEKLFEVIKEIGKYAVILLALGIGKKIKSLIGWILGIKNATQLLNTVLVAGIIYTFAKAIELFDDGNYWGGILATTIGVTLVASMIKLQVATTKTGKAVISFFRLVATNSIIALAGITALVAGVALFVTNFDKLSSHAKVWIPILSALAGVITALAVGLHFAKGNWIKATAIGALVTGAGLGVGTALNIKNYKDGGMPDKGTIFRAGEAGAEVVYTAPSGDTGVVNVQQIATAQQSALAKWWSKAKYDIPAFQGVSPSGIYTIVDGEARRRGKTI